MSTDEELLSQVDRERVIVIARVDSEPLAQILVDKLVGDGIPARYSSSRVHTAWVGTIAMAAANFPIHVPSWSAERARQLLVEERAGEFIIDERRRPTGDLSTRGLVLTSLLIAGVIGAVAAYAFAS